MTKPARWTEKEFEAYLKGAAQVSVFPKPIKKNHPAVQDSTRIPDWIWEGKGLPIPTAEFRFHSVRRWRFDYCFPLQKLAIEIEGGAYTRGRHTRGKGFIGDMAKYNAALLMGYRVLRYPPNAVNYDEIREAFGYKKIPMFEEKDIQPRFLDLSNPNVFPHGRKKARRVGCPTCLYKHKSSFQNPCKTCCKIHEEEGKIFSKWKPQKEAPGGK
jgi:hypothetical protein